MVKQRLPKSIRKFIRLEKARIRRQFFNTEEKTKLINELYQKFSRRPGKTESPVIEILVEQVKAKTKA